MNRKPHQRKVRKVIDCDTFVIDPPIDGFKYIRILNLNCPKKNQSDHVGALLKEKIQGKTVVIVSKTRSYGLIVADVYCEQKHLHGKCQEGTKWWDYICTPILLSLRTFIHMCKRAMVDYLTSEIFRNGGFSL